MSFKWQRNQVQMLIQLFEDNECLYNINSSSYLDRYEKKRALDDILETMKVIIPTITMEDLRKKLKGIRTQYLQEFRQIESSKKTATENDEIYKPKLWCFDQLKFLERYTHVRTTNVTNDESNEDDSTSVIEHITIEKMANKEAMANKIKNVNRLFAERNPTKRRYEWLGRQVSEQMEEIDPTEQPKAVLEIQTVIFKYLQKTLNKVSSSSLAKPLSKSSKRLTVQKKIKVCNDDEDFDSDEDFENNLKRELRQ